MLLIFYQKWFKLTFNDYLDKLKFKSLQICQANDYHPRTGTIIQPCSKYTYHQYCDKHTYLRQISCKMYHFLHDHRLRHIEMNLKAEVELNARLQYKQRFSIKSDRGHTKWIDYLREIIYATEKILNEKEDNIEVIKQHIMFDPVSMHSLEQSHMSLEPGLNYRTKILINNNDDWDNDDINPYQSEDIVNQCDKKKKKSILI